MASGRVETLRSRRSRKRRARGYPERARAARTRRRETREARVSGEGKASDPTGFLVGTLRMCLFGRRACLSVREDSSGGDAREGTRRSPEARARVFQTRATATGRATLGVALPVEDGAEASRPFSARCYAKPLPEKAKKNQQPQRETVSEMSNSKPRLVEHTGDGSERVTKIKTWDSPVRVRVPYVVPEWKGAAEEKNEET